MAEGDGRGGNTAGRRQSHYMPGRGVPLTPEAEDFMPDAFADNIEEDRKWSGARQRKKGHAARD